MEQRSVTLWRGDFELNVSGLYSPGRPGSFYKRNGDPGDPPEPAEFEIDTVTNAEGENIMPFIEDLWVHKASGDYIRLLEDLETDALEKIEDEI